MENTKKEKKEYTKDSLDDGVITTGFLEWSYYNRFFRSFT